MIPTISASLRPLVPRHSLLRFISVVITGGVYLLTKGQSPWQQIVFSLGFGHYALSLIYARKQMIRIVLGQPHTILPCLILLLGCWMLYRSDFSLLIFFGVHHVFNEVYLLERGIGLKDSPEVRAFRTGSLVLQFFLYAALLKHYPYHDLNFLPTYALYAGLAIAYPVFFFLLYRLRSRLTIGERIDLCLFEILGLLVFFASLTGKVHVWFLEIVFYHFVFWSLFPLPKFAAQGRKEVAVYVLLNILLTSFFLTLIWPGVLPFLLPTVVEAHFRFWSYVHITFSFALSSAHPAWITRWFQPRIQKAVS